LLPNLLLKSASSIRSPLYPTAGSVVVPSHHNEHGEHDEHGETHSRAFATVEKRDPKLALFGSTFTRSPLTPSFTTLNVLARKYSTSAGTEKVDADKHEKKRVAVVLSGCGVYDGSEIHEAVSLLVHLSRAGVEYKCFAPDFEQADVINHLKVSPAAESSRNVLVESARIARGKVKALSLLKTETFDALVFPGGYGAAKNLSTFAKDGDACKIQPDVERVVKEFHGSKKPIGFCCVSPVIAARLLKGVKVTLGNEDKDIQDVITKMGAVSAPVGVEEVVVDNTNKIVSTPAYMCNVAVHKVFDGIGTLVESLMSLVTANKK